MQQFPGREKDGGSSHGEPEGGSDSSPALTPAQTRSLVAAALTQDVALAERAGLLQEEPGIHAVPVKLVGAGQNPKPLWGGKRMADVSQTGPGYGNSSGCTTALPPSCCPARGTIPCHTWQGHPGTGKLSPRQQRNSTGGPKR